MPRDFKSFAKENKHVIDENKTQAEDYEKIINKYKDMDNGELMVNLFKEANKLKQEGKLDSATLQNLKSTLAPFLTGEQQSMLNELIQKIDEQK